MGGYKGHSIYLCVIVQVAVGKHNISTASDPLLAQSLIMAVNSMGDKNTITSIRDEPRCPAIFTNVHSARRVELRRSIKSAVPVLARSREMVQSSRDQLTHQHSSSRSCREHARSGWRVPVVALWNLQEPAEQATSSTCYRNGCGYNRNDARSYDILCCTDPDETSIPIFTST